MTGAELIIALILAGAVTNAATQGKRRAVETWQAHKARREERAREREQQAAARAHRSSRRREAAAAWIARKARNPAHPVGWSYGLGWLAAAAGGSVVAGVAGARHGAARGAREGALVGRWAARNGHGHAAAWREYKRQRDAQDTQNARATGRRAGASTDGTIPDPPPVMVRCIGCGAYITPQRAQAARGACPGCVATTIPRPAGRAERKENEDEDTEPAPINQDGRVIEDEPPDCSRCGQPVRGELFITAAGQLCGDCEAAVYRCHTCGGHNPEGLAAAGDDGEIECRTCRTRREHDGRCRTWVDDDERTVVCSGCGAEVDDIEVDEAEGVCRTCVLMRRRETDPLPDDAARRCRCGRGTLQPVPDTKFYGADGGAMVTLRCDSDGCSIESVHYWQWDGDEDDSMRWTPAAAASVPNLHAVPRVPQVDITDDQAGQRGYTAWHDSNRPESKATHTEGNTSMTQMSGIEMNGAALSGGDGEGYAATVDALGRISQLLEQTNQVIQDLNDQVTAKHVDAETITGLSHVDDVLTAATDGTTETLKHVQTKHEEVAAAVSGAGGSAEVADTDWYDDY